MTYKDKRVAAPRIGRELGVDAMVEGSVQRVGDRVRIRAQLVHTASDQHLWAESYDREGKDILLLEKEVAIDIVRQIGHFGASLPDSSRERPRVAADAHDDYLRGRYHWNKRTEPGLRLAIEYFQKTIQREPGYAPAYAGLADSYIMLANWGFAPAAEVYSKAKEAALKAVALDPQLAEAQTSLGYVTLLYDWDWRGAEDKLREAIALNPNYASANHFYSVLLVSAGRQEEAVAEIRRALALDPLSLIVNDVVGWIYYEGRQYDRAIARYGRTLELDPGYPPALLDLATAYLRIGKFQDALDLLEKTRTITGDNGVLLSIMAQAHALSVCELAC